MRLTQIVEALLFRQRRTAQCPTSRALMSVDEDTVEAVIQELRGEYEETERAFQIYEVAGGYQLLTRPDFATFLERYETVPQPAVLGARARNPRDHQLPPANWSRRSRRYPRRRVEQRLKTLIDRGLVEVVGSGEGLVARCCTVLPTIPRALWLRSLEDLPRPDELLRCCVRVP